MANNIVPIGQTRPPSKLLARKGQPSSVSNFTEGVADSFPRLSIRGKAFWVKMNGKEVRAGTVDGQKGAIIDLVLVNASKALAKNYYAKSFATGDAEMPDCWSLDSIRPDRSIVKPVNPTCADCPKNAFNSAPSGRGGKACQDSKRVVVTTADQLLTDNPILLMMRVPQQSLKNMKNHVEYVAGHGYTEPYSFVTRMSFDQNVEFPKVEFSFVEPLTDDEFEAAEALATSKKVNDMLKNPDFDNAAGDANAKHANDEVTTLRHQKRLPQQGFVAAEEPEPEPEAKAENVSRETPAPAEEVWEDMGDGTELNLTTGEVRPVTAEEPKTLELDPDILRTSDGRFFNRATKKFVDGPYRISKAAPITQARAPEPEAEEEKPKPRTRKPRAVKMETVAEEPAQEEVSKANGAEVSKPKVVAASPKLDQLLGSLVPNEDEK